MKTVGDRLIGFYNGYIAPTSKELKVGKKELNVTSHGEYAPGIKRSGSWITGELTPSQLRKTAQQCPLFMKGVRKKCLDGTRAWLELEILPHRGEEIKADLDLIHDFEKRNNFKSVWAQGKINSHIYGDGFLLITFLGDEKTKLWEKPTEGSVPWRVKLMDGEHINEFDFYPPKKKYFERLHTLHYHYLDENQSKDYWIHPDRIIHIPRDPLPNKIFGNSTINLLRNVIKSKVNIDIAVGEILAWFAHGVYDITVPGAEEEETKYWEKIANSHPGVWIHGEDVTIASVNPTAIDPQAFYDYVVLNIAAALVMPTHILKGIEVGRVTGAEIGFADYYRDVKDIQELEDTPLIEKLYKSILENSGRIWKYSLKWNQIYVDELAEAEIMSKRVSAAQVAFSGGFIDQKEARDIFNKGQLKLDITKKIKPKAPPLLPKPENPGIPKPPKQKNEYEHQLDIVEQAMIKRKKEIIVKEKRLGEKILKEQSEE